MPTAEFILMPFGSAGDHFPFIGLGRHLQDRGHTVRVAGNGYFAGQSRRSGLTFDELYSKEEYLKNLNDPDIWHPTKGFAAVVGHPKMAEMVEDQHRYIIEQYVRNPKIIIVGGSLAFGARIARETHGIRLATVHLSPTVFLSALNPPRLPTMVIPRWWPRWMVRFLFWTANKTMIHPVMERSVGLYRRELRLPKIKNYFRDWIHSSEMVLGLWPDWFAEPAADWPNNVKLTGFPFYDSHDAQPLKAEVQAFLNAGERPVVITFGSAMKQGKALFQAAANACQSLNLRAILLTPFTEQIDELFPPTIKRFDYVPLSQLLPYSAALVHHGGIGTTSQGLRAGAPQLITPLAHDQFDNGHRAENLGVARMLPASQANTKSMARALHTLLTDPAIRQNAINLSRRLQDNSTFSRIADELETFAVRSPSTKYWV